MGKWSAFLISLIPAGLAGFLCFLLVTTGLPAAEDMGTMFWGPLGAGFLACVMCVLAPFGIAIFVPSQPQAAPAKSPAKDEDESDDDLSDEFEEAGSADDVEASDDEFDSLDEDSDDDMDFADSADSDFESMEIDADEFSDEFDAFEDDELEEEDK